ncbi:response regulator [Sphingomonas sp. RB3P16]|uniref:response regulator n=1 Tax=Parasphingomonas frigoris TaxID=3096163 RepID=UPI002FCA8AE2
MKMAARQVRRVVIVDDSRISQAILERTFEQRRDFEVVGVAGDAIQAMEMIRRLGPDLVTIDLCMPYIDGAALLESMASRTCLCKIVISDQAVKSILVSSKLESLGASLCLGKREIVDDPTSFFRKIIKTCEGVEASSGYSASLRSISDVTSRPPVRRTGALVHYGYPVPIDEDARLEALQQKHLANAVREREFDLITRFAAETTGFPVCLLTFIDRETQWIKSSFGFEEESCPRSDAFCNYTIAGGELFVVQDAAADPRLRANPLVVGEPGFRTYAGQPVVSAEGVRLGALCVLDTKVRPVIPAMTKKLASIAEIIGSIIDRRPMMAA